MDMTVSVSLHWSSVYNILFHLYTLQTPSEKNFELESIWYLLKRQPLLSPSPQFDIYRPTKTGTEGPTSCGTQPFHADAITVTYNLNQKKTWQLKYMNIDVCVYVYSEFIFSAYFAAFEDYVAKYVRRYFRL